MSAQSGDTDLLLQVERGDIRPSLEAPVAPPDVRQLVERCCGLGMEERISASEALKILTAGAAAGAPRAEQRGEM